MKRNSFQASGSCPIPLGTSQRGIVTSRPDALDTGKLPVSRIANLGSLGLFSLIGATAAVWWLQRERSRKNTIVKAVFFDIDGTLVDSNERHVTVWQEVFREHGAEVGRAAIRGQIGKGGDLLIPALLPGTPEKMVEKLSDRHATLFERDHLRKVRAFDDAAAILRRVRESGRRVVLASSANAREVTHYVTQLEAVKVVDATTSIDDVQTSKPAGDIFAAALKELGSLSPSQVIVVGDTPYDIEAAAKCGIRAVAVRSGGFDDAVLLRAGAIALYDDVSHLLARFEDSPLSR